MPYITAVFIDTHENQNVRDFLVKEKSRIRTIVAGAMGYPIEDVAFFPHRITPADLLYVDNLLSLEFKVDSGTLSLGEEDELIDEMMQDILANCVGADDIHFGIWLISHGKNSFIAHKPN